MASLAPPSPLVFLITGTSQGIGLSLVRHVLSLGHHVIATSRSSSIPTSISALLPTNITKVSPTLHYLPLDLTWPDARITSTISNALALSPTSSIDVLINNAGYCVLGSIEDIPPSKVIEQMNTNFHGPLRVTQLLLPHMRAREDGVIVNISSAQGIVSSAGNGIYAASKFALEAVTEALAEEVEPFGIRVVSMELGAFRTAFGQAGADVVLDKESSPYAKNGHVVGERLSWIADLGTSAPGDPDKAAEVIVQVATGREAMRDVDGKRFLRFVLGEDSWRATSSKIESLRRTWDAQKEWCKRTAFEEEK